MSLLTTRGRGIPFWRDIRVLQWLGQIAVLVVVIAFLYFITRNMLQALSQLGIGINFEFLNAQAGFNMSDTPIEITRESTFARTFFAGVLNTLLVSALGIVFATIIGTLIGIARLSHNYLVNRLAYFYLEALRNTPLLVLLIFWYGGFFLQLPAVDKSLVLGGSVYLSSRGLDFPWPVPTVTFDNYGWILVAGLVAATLVSVGLDRHGRRTGRRPLIPVWFLATLIAAALVGWLVLPSAPLQIVVPVRDRFVMTGGHHFSAELVALVSGLVIYWAAFIGEVIRAGIQSVPRGQVDATRALGLSGYQSLRLVIIPQALRLIIPPLTTQYLALAKSSSLAIAIGFADLFSVSSTILNQTGRAVEVVFLMAIAYLAMNLVTALFMNWYNRRVRLVER
jgi:general L-amino acid transport system permease protein